MDNQDCSTSKQQEADKIEDGTEKKKLKTELLQPANQSDVEVDGECLINQLPPEMLMEIFKCLDVKILLSAKFVNKKWNAIAREILKSREDFETVLNFYWYWNKAGRGYVPQTGKASLENFINRLDDSKEAPFYYTRFRLNDLKASVFNDVDWIKFISDFGENMKSLRLVFKTSMRDFEDTELEQKLKGLIWNQLPNLQEFGLKVNESYNRIPFPTNLKGTTTTTLQLPHLKTFYLDHCSCSKFTDFITDLLQSAVSLQKIELCETDNVYEFYETFRFLQSLGNLDLVQNGKIKPDAAFIFTFKNVPLHFKFKKLELRVEFLNKCFNRSYLQPVSTCLSNLFDSTKDTLTELTTDPLGFLPHFKFPQFSKLISLNFDKVFGFKAKAFPSGTNLMEVFPALQYLDFQVPWTELFPLNEPLSPFPNLKNLKIPGEDMTKNVVLQISDMCPNLRKLVITGGHSRSIQNFPEIGTVMWTRMKNLETLDLQINMGAPGNKFPDVDSCFTGFSQEDCINLGYLIKKQGSEFDLYLEAVRRNPSILDLKDLRNLTLNLISRDWNAASKPDSELFNKTLNLSEKYAFQLMDKLTVNKNQC